MTDKVKICANCRKIKSVLEFHKDSQQTSGYKPYCKICVSIRRKAQYERYRQRELCTTRSYYQANRVKVKIRINKYYQANKKEIMKKLKIHESTTGKWQARQKLRNAVAAGKILKGACFCGEIKVNAHHYLGYKNDNWKDVIWLCTTHHLRAHGKEVVYVTG